MGKKENKQKRTGLAHLKKNIGFQLMIRKFNSKVELLSMVKHLKVNERLCDNMMFVIHNGAF